MRISDWSSDVCSSDLRCDRQRKEARDAGERDADRQQDGADRTSHEGRGQVHAGSTTARAGCSSSRPARRSNIRKITGVVNSVSSWLSSRPPKLAMPSGERKSVVWGKSGQVSVELGGRRLIKKKQGKN